MNMVGHATDAQSRTIETVTDPAEITLHLLPNGTVLQERPAILRRKNQVQVNLSKRLRHGGAPLMLPLQGRSGCAARPWALRENPVGVRRTQPPPGSWHSLRGAAMRKVGKNGPQFNRSGE